MTIRPSLAAINQLRHKFATFYLKCFQQPLLWLEHRRYTYRDNTLFKFQQLTALQKARRQGIEPWSSSEAEDS